MPDEEVFRPYLEKKIPYEVGVIQAITSKGQSQGENYKDFTYIVISNPRRTFS